MVLDPNSQEDAIDYSENMDTLYCEECNMKIWNKDDFTLNEHKTNCSHDPYILEDA